MMVSTARAPHAFEALVGQRPTQPRRRALFRRALSLTLPAAAFTRAEPLGFAKAEPREGVYT